MNWKRRIAGQMESFIPIVSLLAMGIVMAPSIVNANPNLTPGVWTQITPSAMSINDVTQGIIVDPNNPGTVYFCSGGLVPTTYGNIWKTTNGGSTWTASTQLTSVSHVRIDPTNSNHLFAVDGVNGNTMGFWVSTDGGVTWTQPAGFVTMVNNLSTEGYSNFGNGYSISLDPSNPQHILYASHSEWGFVGESFDGGNTWTSHMSPAADNSGGYDVFFLYSPNLAVGNSQTWLLCTQTNGMYRTTNSGSSWTLIPTANAMNHGGNQIYYTKSGVLFAGSASYPTPPQVTSPMKSTDNGITWQGGNLPSGCMGIIGDGTNLYSWPYWVGGPCYTSPESDGLNWTVYSGSPQFLEGPFEMAYDSVNGIVYSSITTNGNGQTAGNQIWALKVLTGSGAPPAPTGLTTTPGNAQVALAWTASSGATGYNVLRSTVNGSGYASVATSIASTSYTNTGLTNGATYYFVVTAANSGGTSGDSNQASATPTAGAPAAPTGLTATPGNTQVSLNWTASAGATSYNVLRSTVSGSGYASVATVTVTTYANTGLTNGTTYYFVVTAANSSGTSGDSNQASATPTSSSDTAQYNFESGIQGWTATGGITSGIATSGTEVFAGAHSLSVSFNGTAAGTAMVSVASPSVPDGSTVTFHVWVPSGSTITTLQPYISGGTWAGDDTSISNVTLNAWNTFTVYVPVGMAPDGSLGVEFNTTGAWTGTCYIDSVSWPTGSAPAAPTGLTASPGNTQVALSWTASTGATSYNVYRGTSAGGESATAVATGLTTAAFTNTGLTNGTKYYFTVKALNSSGTSSGSNEASATPQVGAPAAPTGLTATLGNAQVALSWTASSGATSYNVLRSTVTGSGYASVVTEITATAYTNTGLTNGVTYYFVVTAVNAGGTSGNSNQASGTPTSSSDPSQYNFESSTQGWSASGGITSGVATSTTHAFLGAQSLAVNFNGTAAGTAMVSVASPSVPDGSTITYHVWVPSGSTITTLQPYISGGTWAGDDTNISNVTLNAWNTYTVYVPVGMAPDGSLGVEFNTTGAWTGTCYIDSISW